MKLIKKIKQKQKMSKPITPGSPSRMSGVGSISLSQPKDAGTRNHSTNMSINEGKAITALHTGTPRSLLYRPNLVGCAPNTVDVSVLRKTINM